jgi:hypothetical protein
MKITLTHLESEKRLSIGKRIKRKLKGITGAPKKHIKDLKLKGFAVGYQKVSNQYDLMKKEAARAGKNIRAGVLLDESKRFLDGKALDFFPGRASRHLYSDDEMARLSSVKVKVQEISMRLEEGNVRVLDGDWLCSDFQNFLEECKLGDLWRLQRGFKFDKGIPTIGGDGEEENGEEKD